MRKNKVGRKKNGFSMFILDDDKNMTDALQSYFGAAGYVVEQSNDPIEALERLREKSFDILLLDFIMYPICGDEVVARLREFDTNIYVIMLTGHREVAPPLNTIHELDIQGYFEKSDRFDQLELLVESCIKSIRQMKIVYKYQEGLSHILDAVPKMNPFLPLEEFAGQVLRQLQTLTGSDRAFAWIIMEELLQGEELEEVSRELFMGSGKWREFSLDTFLEAFPKMRVCMNRKEVSVYQGDERRVLLVPLKVGKDQRLGMLGVAEPESGAIKRDLLAVFSEQVSAALHNSILHMLVEMNNSKIKMAYNSLEKSYMETIEALRLLVDAKDIYTRGHSDRVAYYAGRLAAELGKPSDFIERVKVAGLLHDIGKIGVSDDVLKKQDGLTEKEFASIRLHPEKGADILSKITMFQTVAPIVAAHHERYDGKGYPNSLKGEQIPEEARMISIADAFDAMTSDRHYRKKLSRERVLKELEKGKNSQFDGEMVEAFLEILEDFEEIKKELLWTYQVENL